MNNTLKNKFSILGCPFSPYASTNDLKQAMVSLLKKERVGYSVAINAEKIMRYHSDQIFRAYVDDASLLVPDGSGAVLACKFLYGVNSIKVDFATFILELANELGFSLFVLGASEKNNKKAYENIQLEYPNIKLCGRANGYFESDDKIYKKFESLQVDIVLTALGSPKQEIFMNNASKNFEKIFFVGVGGMVDVIARAKKAAPAVIKRCHTEWLYRLIKEPSRIKRQKIIPIYISKVIKQKISKES